MQVIERKELVVDFAHHTPLVEPEELLAAGVQLAIIKADGMFREHAQRCIDAGLPVCAYHWEDVTWSSSGQVKQTLDIVEGMDIVGVMLDWEHWWSSWGDWWQAIYKNIAWNAVRVASPSSISSHAEETVRLLKEAGIYVFGYSSKNFIDTYVAPYSSNWINELDWVMAHYRYQPASAVDISWEELKEKWLPDYEPLKPLVLDIDKVIGHQFTGDRFGLPGMYANTTKTKRARADVNVFNKVWLDKLLSDEPEVTVPPVEGVDDMEEALVYIGDQILKLAEAVENLELSGVPIVPVPPVEPPPVSEYPKTLELVPRENGIVPMLRPC